MYCRVRISDKVSNHSFSVQAVKPQNADKVNVVECGRVVVKHRTGYDLKSFLMSLVYMVCC